MSEVETDGWEEHRMLQGCGMLAVIKVTTVEVRLVTDSDLPSIAEVHARARQFYACADWCADGGTKTARLRRFVLREVRYHVALASAPGPAVR